MTTRELPNTLRFTKKERFYGSIVSLRRSVKDELRANLICKLQRREELFPRHRRLRGQRRSAGGQRDSVPAQFHPAGIARTGENPPDPHADHAVRSVDALRRRMRDSRQSVRPDLPPMQGADRGEGRCDAHRVSCSRAPVRRKAGDARCDDRGHDRRYRSDQSGAARAGYFATN